MSRLVLFLAVCLGLSSCGLFRIAPPEYEPVVFENGLVVQDLVVPDAGREAVAGDRVSLHYEGRLEHGTVFDSSYERGEPIAFELGAGQVPAGLDQGVVGMRLFGRRRLIVPPALGYGEDGIPDLIPPAATLVFELELLGFEEP